MRIIALAVFLFSPAPVLAADCDTDLKPTDTYKELSAKLRCLNDRINSLESNGNAVSQKSVISGKPSAGTQVQEFDGIQVETQNCTKANVNITCRFAVTAKESKAYFWENTSYAMDNNGMVFGNVQYRFVSGISFFGSVNLNGGVRYVIFAEFKGSNKPGEMITELQIHLASKAFEFKNIKIPG